MSVTREFALFVWDRCGLKINGEDYLIINFVSGSQLKIRDKYEKEEEKCDTTLLKMSYYVANIVQE